MFLSSRIVAQPEKRGQYKRGDTVSGVTSQESGKAEENKTKQSRDFNVASYSYSIPAWIDYAHGSCHGSKMSLKFHTV